MSDGRVRRRRAPGWYRDPDDPTRMRHWSGRAWSARHRSWPAWDISVVDLVADLQLPGGPEAGAGAQPVTDGPVRPAALPATAAARAAGLGAMVTWLAQPVAAPGGAGRSGGARWATRSGGAAAPGWQSSRRPVVVFAALVAVALVLMAASVGLSRPRPPVASVASDPSFLARATALCATGLAPLRGSAEMTATDPGAAEEAAAATRAADTVDGLAGKLAALGPSPAAAGGVGAWLATWDAYAADQRLLAASLGAPVAGTAAAGSDPAALRRAVDADATQADDFASVNGLGGCRLRAAGTPGVVAIP